MFLYYFLFWVTRAWLLYELYLCLWIQLLWEFNVAKCAPTSPISDTWEFHFLNKRWGPAEGLHWNGILPSWIRQGVSDVGVPQSGARFSHTYLEVLGASVVSKKITKFQCSSSLKSICHLLSETRAFPLFLIFITLISFAQLNEILSFWGLGVVLLNQ